MSKPYRGKKIGTLTVRLKSREDGVHAKRAHVDVELRFDVGRGDFHAAYAGEWHTSKTQKDLQDQIAKVADKEVSMVWHRYLKIAYSMEAHPINSLGDGTDRGCYETFGLDEDRASMAGDPSARGSDERSPKVVTGLNLRWDLVDITEPYEVPERPGKMVRAERAVFALDTDDDDGRHVGHLHEREDAELERGLLLYGNRRRSGHGEKTIGTGGDSGSGSGDGGRDRPGSGRFVRLHRARPRQAARGTNDRPNRGVHPA